MPISPTPRCPTAAIRSPPTIGRAPACPPRRSSDLHDRRQRHPQRARGPVRPGDQRHHHRRRGRPARHRCAQRHQLRRDRDRQRLDHHGPACRSRPRHAARRQLSGHRRRSEEHPPALPDALPICTIAGNDILNALEAQSDLAISGTTTGVEDGQHVTVVLNGTSYDATVTGNAWTTTVPHADLAHATLPDGSYQVTADDRKSTRLPSPTLFRSARSPATTSSTRSRPSPTWRSAAPPPASRTASTSPLCSTAPATTRP